MRHDDVEVPAGFAAGPPPPDSAEPIASISHMVARERELAYRAGYVAGHEARDAEVLQARYGPRIDMDDVPLTVSTTTQTSSVSA